MTTALAFVFGMLFGLGLIVSGMSDPAKIIGFLDLAGPWDPSLMLVMVGAIAIGLVGFTLAKRRDRSLLGLPTQLPTSNQLDRRLVIGSLLFGLGWGLAGICPGPALVLLGAGSTKGIVFTLAMLAGMALFEYQHHLRQIITHTTDA